MTFETKAEAYAFDEAVKRHGYPPPGWSKDGIVSDGINKRTVHAVTVAMVDRNTNILDRTRADYERIIRRYLQGTVLGDTPVIAVTADNVKDWIRYWQKQGKSAKTIRGIHALVSQALEQEQTKGIIRINPARGLGPKIQTKPEMRVMTKAQAQAFLERFEGKDREMVTGFLETGLRFQELTALRWSDLDGDTLQVRRAWKGTAVAGRTKEGPPKTEAGKRVVLISEAFAETLEKRRGKPSDLIFGTSTGGKQYYGNWFSRVWRPRVLAAYEAGEIPEKVRIHDLRHTLASWMYGDPEALSPIAIAALLGHADPAVGLRIYGHPLGNEQDRARQVMQRISVSGQPSDAHRDGRRQRRPRSRGTGREAS